MRKKTAKLSHGAIRDGEANVLLLRFLRMNEHNEAFQTYFSVTKGGSTGWTLKPEVQEALKTIGGLKDKPTDAPRCLCYNGAWLLALGQFRQLFPEKDWLQVFSPSELSTLGHQFSALHPKQKEDEFRHKTLVRFGKMCEVLFADRADPAKCVLEKVKLTPNCLSFTLDFTSKRLFETIKMEVQRACGDEGIEASHDSAEAIWKLWVSCSFSEFPKVEAQGIFGNQRRMNIFPNGNKTEVRFGG